ncbi:MAG: CotH kinase family protein, partial [Bacteroidota bacterium]
KNLLADFSLKKLSILILVLHFNFQSNAQIIISEFSAANQGDFISSTGDDNEDWIELHNEGTTSTDIGGYFLSDRLGNPDKWEIPAGTTIGAGGYLRVWCSGLDTIINNELHTNFRVTQTRNNEDIVLADPSGVVIDFNELNVPNQIHHSYGKDANGNWGVSLNPTPGNANGTLYEGYAEKPSMSLPAGFYSGQATVSIIVPTNTTVYYTTDGSRPNDGDTPYTGEISIANTTVLRAVAYHDNPNILPSFFTTNTYFIDEDHTIPVVSVSGGAEINTLLSGTQNEPLGYFELFDEDGMEVDEGQGFYNKHGNDSWAYDQRGFDWIMRDQTGYDDDVTGQIFEQKDRTDYQRLIFKAAANDNYQSENGAHVRDAYVHTLSQLADLEMDERTSKFCIVYINGQYWGVYDMREKVDDHDFTDYYYNQGREWIDFIKTWGGTWQEYGSWDDWYALRDFIFNNDMTIDANYDYVEERMEVLSLIDYVLLHAHIVSADWLNWNTAWWRGRNPDGEARKWRYILWDEDATFGHYINYTGVPNTSANADPCNVELISSDFEGHIEIFTNLYENENFRQLYINRYADLNNSFFTCDYMNGLLDSMIAVIEPEMQRHIDRWGNAGDSYNDWQNNVQTLKDFIDTRCTNIDQGIVDCYDVTGPYSLTVNVEPANSPNRVKVNTFIPNQFPYVGDYFGGIDVSLEAVPGGDWAFEYWEVANQTFAPDQFALAIEVAMQQEDTVTAFFAPGIPCGQPADVVVTPTNFGVDIDWVGPPNAISYEVRYRELGTTDWISISTDDLEYDFFNLESCTDYELEVRSICQVSLSSYFTTVFQTECTNSTSELDGSHINNFRVFPNPFQEVLNVEFDLANSENIIVEMHTLHGQLLLQESKGNMTEGRHVFSLPLDPNWSTGMYLVRIVTENGSVVNRVMKAN